MVTWAMDLEMSEYVYQRIGREEYLGVNGELVEDIREARVAFSVAEAHAWLAEVVDDPTVWQLTPRVLPCVLCGKL